MGEGAVIIDFSAPPVHLPFDGIPITNNRGGPRGHGTWARAKGGAKSRDQMPSPTGHFLCFPPSLSAFLFLSLHVCVSLPFPNLLDETSTDGGWGLAGGQRRWPRSRRKRDLTEMISDQIWPGRAHNVSPPDTPQSQTHGRTALPQPRRADKPPNPEDCGERPTRPPAPPPPLPLPLPWGLVCSPGRRQS